MDEALDEASQRATEMPEAEDSARGSENGSTRFFDDLRKYTKAGTSSGLRGDMGAIHCLVRSSPLGRRADIWEL